MSLLVAWVLFPALLLLIATGCGLVVEAVSRTRMPAILLPGVGLAALMLILQFATLRDWTAEIAVPLGLAVATAGIVTGLPRLREARPDPWAAGCAVAVFAVFAAPVVLSGEATFTGYVKLDDTASWLGITERLFDEGYTLDGLAPSTYEATLDFYLSSDYPVAVFTPLGVGDALTGQDVAWLWQPYLATLAVMLALALYSLASGVIESRPGRALACFVASQPALLFGFYLWGGIKELAAAWTLALMAALLPLVLDGDRPGSRVAPFAVVSAATLAILSIGGAIWVGPVAGLALILLVRNAGARRALGPALVFVAIAVLLALPELLALGFLDSAASSTDTLSLRLANLIEPLSPLQAFGIWPVRDFRVRPEDPAITYLLIAVAAAMFAAGAAWLWARRRRDPAVGVYVVAAAVGCLAVTIQDSPWFNAKALATATPAFLLCALIGIWSLRDGGRRRAVAGGAAVLVTGGVLWSTASGYQGANLAPRERLAELDEASARVGEAGPTLMTEYEPYGVRHFLRRAAPEGASELRRRTIPLRSGLPLEKGEVADLDAFELEAILAYRTIVLRTSPATSRPPAPYRRIWSGRWYEVWQRPADAPRVLRHLPLGTNTDPGGRAPCARVLRLAQVSGVTTLATVRPPFVTVLGLDRPTLPAGWTAAGSGSGSVSPEGSGTVEVPFRLTAGGRTAVWVGGAFRGRVEVEMDGRRVGGRRNELSHAGQYVELGETSLGPGRHRLRLRYDDGGLHPGSAGGGFSIGPVILAAPAPSRQVEYVDPSQAGSLCGERLDWVEALGVS